MQVRTLCLVALIVGACPTAALAQDQGDNFETSLHYTLKGKETWYNAENGGFENWTGVPIEQLGCLKCHGAHDANGDPYPDDWFEFEQSCIDCHQVEGGGDVVQEQCFTCHAQQDFEMNLFGYADAHREEGMLCWDCHGPEDLMGDGTVYDSLLAPGAIKADCESADCHPPGSLPANHDEYDPEDLHHGTIHCNACHTQSVIGCFNCHLDSVAESNVYRWQQPINGFTMLLNRDRDDKLSSGAFHGITYQGDAFLAVAPYRAHTNLKEARACTECHNNLGGHNPTIEEYNTTGIIQFTEWDEEAGVLTWNQGLVPIPVDWQKRMKFDFLQYDGATTDPLVFGDPNWSKIGKTTPDGTMMLYASPLSVHQMRAMGMAVPVELDLKPGGCPNPLNVSSAGKFPAAILGSAELDVFEIDELTVQLEGVAPFRISYEDVAGPAEGQLCECAEEGPDGHIDLVMKFSTPELAEALGEGVMTGDTPMLVLTGTFLPDDSGLQPAPIVGTDCVVIRGVRVPPGVKSLMGPVFQGPGK
ncbi:MAG: cytochrome c3 family protein [Planctomycetota bacterium]|jgi:hypothetical protein